MIKKNVKSRRRCICCLEKVDHFSLEHISFLRKFMSDRGKIMPRRMTGACNVHQRRLAKAIKYAREISHLPYIVR